MSITYPRESSDTLSSIEPDGFDSPSTADWYQRVKIVADVVVAILLLVLFAPLILILMILVKATSPGPAVYKQLRLGRRGQPYEIFKLRTMANDCEKQTGPQWSKPKDPRVTPLGRFLRRSHLDELPQLWNVIRGEMSLVGPRPERPEFVDDLVLKIPNYRERMQVRPGITGLAQVQLPADSDVDDVRRKVRCDLCYIERVDPILDFQILVATIFKVAGAPFSLTRQLLRLPGPDHTTRFPDRVLEADAVPLAPL